VVHNLISKPLAGLILLATCTSQIGHAQESNPDPYANETKEQRDARLAWFREAKFGLMITWGMHAVPAGTHNGEKIGAYGEHIMRVGQIPVAEYKPYAKAFNPVNYDPDAWVRLAKEAGMKYIVIITKHHDGFALWDSKASEWDVVDATPYGKDLLKPLAEACRKHGMKLGFYYSQSEDWCQGGAFWHNRWDPAHTPATMDKYIDSIAVPQVRELLTKYGPVSVFWWDTPSAGMNNARAGKLSELLSLQPGIIHNDRIGGGFKGDIRTAEQVIPGSGIEGGWEACMTMNNTWGYKSYDHDWKPTGKLIRNLVDVVCKGGNYAGKPWLSQYWVRRVNEHTYGGTTPETGYGGHDEDQAQIGAWFVMSALKLFQTDGGCRTEPSSGFRKHSNTWIPTGTERRPLPSTKSCIHARSMVWTRTRTA
jgi:alpha-L-fucosidase